MSIKKKGLLAVVTGCMLLVLMACGGDTDDDERTTIVFSHWGGETTFETVYRDRIAEFERQNPDIRIEVLTVADGYDTVVQTMLIGREQIDVIQLAEAAPQFALRNQLLDLTDFINEAGIDLEENWADGISQYQIGDRTFGLPDRGGPMILYYNKDLFDEAGLAYPDETWTAEQLQDALEALTIVENGETVQWGGSWLSWFPQWGNEIKRHGGHFIENGEVVVNSPQNLAALTTWLENYETGYITTVESLESSVHPNGDGMFAAGEIALLMTGFWNIASFAEVDDLNFDIVPVWIGDHATTWPFGSALTIASNSKHSEEAFRFIEFMTGYEGQLILGESMGDSPAHLGVLNSDDFINREINGKDLSLDVIATSAERVMIDELFQMPFYADVSSRGGDFVQEMLLGRMTPQQVLDELEVEMLQLMDEFSGVIN